MSRIFISYSRKDEPFARRLAEALSNLGADIWIDVEDIPAGMNWSKAIWQGLDLCEVMLVILSPDSAVSQNVEEEWQYYRDKRKPYLPVLLRPVENVHYQLSRVQYINFHKYDFATAFRQLHTELARIGFRLKPIDDSAAPTQPSPPAPLPQGEGSQPPVSADPTAALAEAEQALDSGQFERAIALLKAAQTPGLAPAYQRAIEKLLNEAEAEKTRAETEERAGRERLEAEQRTRAEYAQLVPLVKGKRTRDVGCDEWRAFRQKYPTFADTEKLADLCPDPPPDLSGILPAPFEWCFIPSGNVTIEYGEWKDSKYIVQRRQDFPVAAFHIAKYPVTNAQFQKFVDDEDGYRNAKWWDYSNEAKAWRKQNGKPRDPAFGGVAEHPRANVTWYEAVAFCRWLEAKVKALTLNPSPSGRGTLPPFALREKGQGDEGWAITLLTEQQWQRAAQGDDGREYPWVGGFDKTQCNTSESGIGRTTPVTQYPQGASPFGVLDMAGDVWKWCLTTWEGNSNAITGDMPRVLRGGSWYLPQVSARAAYRSRNFPLYFGNDNGFRCSYHITL